MSLRFHILYNEDNRERNVSKFSTFSMCLCSSIKTVFPISVNPVTWLCLYSYSSISWNLKKYECAVKQMQSSSTYGCTWSRKPFLSNWVLGIWSSHVFSRSCWGLVKSKWVGRELAIFNCCLVSVTALMLKFLNTIWAFLSTKLMVLNFECWWHLMLISVSRSFSIWEFQCQVFQMP